jgi:hypothetical protein
MYNCCILISNKACSNFTNCHLYTPPCSVLSDCAVPTRVIVGKWSKIIDRGGLCRNVKICHYFSMSPLIAQKKIQWPPLNRKIFWRPPSPNLIVIAYNMENTMKKTLISLTPKNIWKAPTNWSNIFGRPPYMHFLKKQRPPSFLSRPPISNFWPFPNCALERPAVLRGRLHTHPPDCNWKHKAKLHIISY